MVRPSYTQDARFLKVKWSDSNIYLFISLFIYLFKMSIKQKMRLYSQIMAPTMKLLITQTDYT